MSECEKLKDCIFFNDRMVDMPDVSEMLKNRYCRGDNSKCARYMVATTLGKDKVPPDLFPHMTERAQEILAKG